MLPWDLYTILHFLAMIDPIPIVRGPHSHVGAHTLGGPRTHGGPHVHGGPHTHGVLYPYGIPESELILDFVLIIAISILH